MRNIMQLLGGVAVAGVVAAGSTAFTAGSGFFSGASGAAPVIVGGTLAAPITVTGATIDTLVFAHDATVKNNIDYFDVALVEDDGTTAITTGTVYATVTATSGTATEVTCALSTAVFRCTAGADWVKITAIAARYVE
ncbi:hypothetical protein [Actinoplanes palleronii]|uniref:Uncharacterized protein n=1 Tax=Actinoplanes palleronii TaxID=113570 RepID=A0ABQ4B8V8_9ACTN|nr:hypothetical protein [Actinoplanes palleronii]GIE66866.1 hypothetical protein Apa02nite_029740 [Actinoplanes palleronii]